MGLESEDDLIFGTTPNDDVNFLESGNLSMSMIYDVKYADDRTPKPGIEFIS